MSRWMHRGERLLLLTFGAHIGHWTKRSLVSHQVGCTGAVGYWLDDDQSGPSYIFFPSGIMPFTHLDT